MDSDLTNQTSSVGNFPRELNSSKFLWNFFELNKPFVFAITAFFCMTSKENFCNFPIVLLSIEFKIYDFLILKKINTDALNSYVPNRPAFWSLDVWHQVNWHCGNGRTHIAKKEVKLWGEAFDPSFVFAMPNTKELVLVESRLVCKIPMFTALYFIRVHLWY
jgi:hypothetical protein